MKAKRRKATAERKAAKLAAYRQAGDSTYALKARRNAKGNLSPRSPFRSEVTVVREEASA